MSISAIGGSPATYTAKTPERLEGPGPDKVNDHDADDRAGAPAPGTGTVVDKMA